MLNPGTNGAEGNVETKVPKIRFKCALVSKKSYIYCMKTHKVVACLAYSNELCVWYLWDIISM